MRLQGVEELVLVKLAAMMLVEPWSMDIKKMMDMMLGLGQVELRVRRSGWDGDLQFVEM